MRWFRSLAPALWMLLVAGCAAVDVAQYREEKPVLDLAQYFSGPVEGWGMFQDRSGLVVKRFHVRLDGTWTGNEGTLTEEFAYSDGTRETRVWKIVKDGHRYTGTAGDVVGIAQGEAAGNTLRWDYVLVLPVDGRTWHMDMDDWMMLIDEKTLLNRTTMSKFGVKVGEVTLAFRRQ